MPSLRPRSALRAAGGLVPASWATRGVGCVGVVLLAAAGVAFVLQGRAPGVPPPRPVRREVPANVDGLKTAELAHDAAFDRFVACGNEPVRGAYWTTDEGADFGVHGIVDEDGDGRFAHYVATRYANATLVSDPAVE